MAWRLVALGVLLGCLSACSSSDDSSGSGGAGTGGSGGSSGSSTVGVSCTTGICTSPELCCVSGASLPEGGIEPGCAHDCPVEMWSLSCDGPEDCGGNACCGAIASSFECSTTPACNAGSQLCHTNKDCPSGQTCVPVTSNGLSFGSCAKI